MKKKETIKQSKMLQLAKHLQIPVIPVKYFTYDYLYNLQNDLFHNELRVHSEFYNLSHVPFQIAASLTFKSGEARWSESEVPRRELLGGFLTWLNGKILANHPTVPAGKSTVRAAWVVEHGKNRKVNAKPERHCHMLLHIDRNAPPTVAEEVLADCASMRRTELNRLGIATLHTQELKTEEAKTRCISYFCKFEGQREFKTVDYSKWFFPVVKRMFLPPEGSREVLKAV
jgi:hypothetical protein